MEDFMSRMSAATTACAVMLSTGATVGAQSKVIPGEHRTVTATVETVDVANRKVTVRMDSGEMRTIQAPEKATRLTEITPGDKVTATYYDNMVLRVKPVGEADVDTRQSALTPGTGARPAGTAATQQTITATIDAIDLKAPSISLKGPRGWTYSSRVQDVKALQQVKVGDRVDITWTEATLVSVAAQKPATTGTTGTVKK
jgi:Cu/Ag efflux protein CusF